MNQIIHINRGEERQVEEEERNSFIRNCLIESGVPIDSFWTEDNLILSVGDKIKLRDLLDKYNVEVINEDDCFQIYFESNLIGQWLKPKFSLKIDLSNINPAKRVFVEMVCEFYSVFIEEEEEL